MSPFKLPKSLTELKHAICLMDEDTVEIVIGLHVILSDEKKIVKWLTTKNPFFGSIAPLKLMQIGRSHKVKQFVDMAVHEMRLDWPDPSF